MAQLGCLPVYSTTNIFHTLGLDDPDTIDEVIRASVRALLEPDPEDYGGRKLRALEKDGKTYWAILEPGVLTLLLPEDY